MVVYVIYENYLITEYISIFVLNRYLPIPAVYLTYCTNMYGCPLSNNGHIPSSTNTRNNDLVIKTHCKTLIFTYLKPVAKKCMPSRVLR